MVQHCQQLNLGLECLLADCSCYYAHLSTRNRNQPECERKNAKLCTVKQSQELSETAAQGRLRQQEEQRRGCARVLSMLQMTRGWSLRRCCSLPSNAAMNACGDTGCPAAIRGACKKASVRSVRNSTRRPHASHPMQSLRRRLTWEAAVAQSSSRMMIPANGRDATQSCAWRCFSRLTAVSNR